MKFSELLNPRISYHVLVTFDLEGSDSSIYEKIRADLENELDLEKFISLGKEDGGNNKKLPHNTFAVLWTKDNTEQETRDYFQKIILSTFEKYNLHGCYVILVAQNWAVSAGNF